ncbi:MFS transporter [Nakamurella leprariae]|uniref:MFS transporter n=1 Tax=Nakamurella leprariae TaxID=2803911 RepID=A0A938YI80_9ACTN|nr:MFS transporter [Nakamurella leprariae]MBM9468629.1 MFS transporter [Nakamurella leprariae]
MVSDPAGAPASGPAEFSGHARGSAGYRRILIALFCAGIATFAQLYSPQGLLPLLADDLTITATQAALSVSVATTGLAVSVLPWSALADRIGRVAAMRISLVSMTVLGLATPLAPDLTVLLVIRALEGVALGGLPALAMTYLAEEIRRAETAVAAGTYVSGTTIGGLLGRLVAGPVGDLGGWRLGVTAVAVMAGAAAVAASLLLPAPRGYRRQVGVGAGRVLRACLTHLGRWRLLVLFLQGFLLMGSFVAVYNYLGFHLTAAPYGLPTAVTSLLFLAYLAGTVSSRVAGRWVSRFGVRAVLVGSAMVFVAGAALTLAGPLPVVALGLVVLTTGFFAGHAAASGAVGVTATEHRAQATALYILFYYAGSSLVGWLAGLDYDAGGWGGVVLLVCLLVGTAGALMALPGSAPRRSALRRSD